MTAFFTYGRLDGTIVYTTPLYGGTTGLIHQFLGPLHTQGIAVASGDAAGLDAAIAAARNLCMVYLETPANPTLNHDGYRAGVRGGGSACGSAAGGGGQYACGPDVSASAEDGRGSGGVLGDEILGGASAICLRGWRWSADPEIMHLSCGAAERCSVTSCSPMSAGCWIAGCPPWRCV